jgi:AraC-like DNA-binding protein
MRYFRDLEFVAFDHVPRCSVWIDRRFEHYWALNFAPAGRIAWGMGMGVENEGPPLTHLNAPVVWWTWPGQHFRYGCVRPQSWDQYYVTFAGPRAARIFEEGLTPARPDGRPFAPVAAGQAETLRHDWETLFALLRTHGRRDNPEAVHLLEGMLLRLRRRAAPTPDSDPSGMASLAAAIRAAPNRDWDWEAEAARRAVSLVHLRRRFREETGLPPHRFLLQTRMEAAARLLLTTDRPVKAVGAAVGVGDPYYFSKLFKAHFRLPPDRYRREAGPYSAEKS